MSYNVFFLIVNKYWPLSEAVLNFLIFDAKLLFYLIGFTPSETQVYLRDKHFKIYKTNFFLIY